MPLSDDQKAILRLLAQREQGYDDLAALMGLSVEEVRAKVAAALAQLEQEGEAPPPLPDEEPAAPVEPEPAEKPAAPAAPTEPVVEQPEQPPPPPPAKPKAPQAEGAMLYPQAVREDSLPSRRPRAALPRSSGARAAIAAGVAVVVLVIVVLAVGGGDDSGDTSAGSNGGSTASGEATNTAAGGKEVTQAVLSPVGGGEASGVATFGRVKNSLALQIEASGLEPTGDGESYTLWLYQSPTKMLPLASTRVDKSGRIGAQVEVPAEVLAYLAQETFDQIDVSLTTDATLKASLAKATREKKAPLYTGTDVLRGPITGPIVGATTK